MNQFTVLCPVVVVASVASVTCCIHVPQETGKVVWYSHVFKNFPQFVVILTGKGFSLVIEAEIDVVVVVVVVS